MSIFSICCMCIHLSAFAANTNTSINNIIIFIFIIRCAVSGGNATARWLRRETEHLFFCPFGNILPTCCVY